MYYLIGAAFGLLCLLPFIKSSTRTLAMNGYLALAIMVSIYLGAYLTTGNMHLILHETFVGVVFLGLATLSRKKRPLGIGFLVLAHGAYDHFLGHKSGVIDWYPPVCAGFDVIVGSGLIFLMLRQSKQTQTG